MFEQTLKPDRAKVDWVLILALIGLMLMGWAFVYSATMADVEEVLKPLFKQNNFRQIIWYLLGSAAAVACCVIDYHVILRWALVFYWGTIIMLVLVLIPHIGS